MLPQTIPYGFSVEPRKNGHCESAAALVEYSFMSSEALFNEIQIWSVQDEQKHSLRKAVADAPISTFSRSDEEIFEEFVKQFSIEVPILNQGNREITEEEIDIDISRDPRRMLFDRSNPFYVKGTRITVHVPFTGEAILFRVQPNSYSLSPPRGRVSRNELLIIYEFVNDTPPTNLKLQLESALREIESYLQRLRESASQLDAELRNEVVQAVSRRKAELKSKQSLIADLGIPKRTEQLIVEAYRPSAVTPVTLRAAMRKTRATTSWHVFLSHASEDKESAAKPIADALIARGIQVWFDDYTLRIGDSLRQKIDEGLTKSRYGIVLLSKAFFAKHWPQQELNGLAAREVNGKKVILPVWFEITQSEIAQSSPILADRLGALMSSGLDKVVEDLLQAMEL